MQTFEQGQLKVEQRQMLKALQTKKQRMRISKDELVQVDVKNQTQAHS